MRRGFFVTGTDTGVGKTTVAAALLHRLRPHTALRYWKPIQTGIESDDDTETVRKLGACAEAELQLSGVRLPRPLSPHLAARLAGVRIELDSLGRAFQTAAVDAVWVVEGAGGVMVPINEKEMMVDLVARLELPAVIVARSGLGTINHTLLTLEALGRRSLPVAGVVMVGDANAENRAAIGNLGRVPVLGEMPRFADLTSGALGAWARAELDTAGRLLEWLS